MRAALAGPHLRRYLAAQLLSLFGDNAAYLALGVWVKTLTGSAAAAGLVFFAFMLPALFAPASGLLVDRVRRRPLLVAVNLATAVGILPVLLVSGTSTVWIVYAVAMLYGVSSSLVGSAQSALLTVLVDRESLGEVNGVLQTGKEIVRLSAPLAGAGLYAWTGGPQVVIWLDVATFVVAAALLTSLRVAEPAPTPGSGHWRADLTAGLHHVIRTKPLAQLVFTTAACTAVFGFFETLVYSVTDSVHRAPSFIGVLSAAQGIGSVAGGLTAAALLRRTGAVRLGGLGLAVVAGGFCLLPTGMLAPVLAGSVVFGVGLPWLVVALVTTLQRSTPPALQGRVMAVADVALNVPMTISIAVGAALVAVVDYRALIGVDIVVTALAAAFLLTRPRSADEPLVEVAGAAGHRSPAELLDGPAPAGLAHAVGEVRPAQ